MHQRQFVMNSDTYRIDHSELTKYESWPARAYRPFGCRRHMTFVPFVTSNRGSSSSEPEPAPTCAVVPTTPLSRSPRVANTSRPGDNRMDTGLPPRALVLTLRQIGG